MISLRLAPSVICAGSMLFVASLALVPEYRWGAVNVLYAQDERPGRSFLRNLENSVIQRQQNQNRGQGQGQGQNQNQNQNRGTQPRGSQNQFPFQPNQGRGNPNSPYGNPSRPPIQQGQQPRHHWLNDAVQGLHNIESHDDRYDREEVRMSRLWQQGRISHSQYDKLLDVAVKRLGSQDHDYHNYDNGWQQRNTQWQRWQQTSQMNVDQKKLGLEYVKYGDRPLEADKGLVPKPNPILSNPQHGDDAEATRLANAIDSGIKDDLAEIRRSLPEGCRIEDAIALVEKLKSDGAQPELVTNLQAAVVDRDVRRFERNAQALLVPAQEVQRLSLGVTIEHLQDKLEDKATSKEIAKITETLVRRIDEAGLDNAFTQSLAAWLKNVPEMLHAQQNLAQHGKADATKAWPNGQLKLIFDPQLTSGETRLLPGDLIATAGNGEPRITLGSGDKYTANGLGVFKNASQTVATDAKKAKPETPTLMLDYPSENGQPLSYTIICFQEQPTDTPGQFQPTEAWRQEYSIKPGLSQSLPLAWNGKTWYQINCHSQDRTAPDKAYSLKPQTGYSPTYEFSVSGNIVTLVSTSSNITLDNSRNARPFQFMLGNQYQTIRAGAKTTFDSGVTLQYARNGKTAVPKDAEGKPIPNAAAESTDISTVTLRGNTVNAIGINSEGEWEIRPSAEVVVAQRQQIDLTNIIAQRPDAAPAPVAKSATPAKTDVATSVATPRGTLYVLAVGISKYKNPGQFPNLSFADKDATVLSEVLEKQKKLLFTDVQTKVLTNDEATAIKIRTELVGLERQATKNDTVALILSGHGVIDNDAYYFCPHDTDRAKLARQGISCTELQKVTDNLSAKNVFVFLDSCYSGGATDKLQAGFEKQVSRVGSSGVVIFASSKGTESSQEDKSWGHGALTKAFLDTIADPEIDLNNDSILQVAELDRGLAEGVKKLTDGGQHLQSAELGDSIRNLSLVRLGN